MLINVILMNNIFVLLGANFPIFLVKFVDPVDLQLTIIISAISRNRNRKL